VDIPRIPSQNRPHDDKNVVQFTNSTESRSFVASRDYLISDSLGFLPWFPHAAAQEGANAAGAK
jgi:hypothetical protein